MFHSIIIIIPARDVSHEIKIYMVDSIDVSEAKVNGKIIETFTKLQNVNLRNWILISLI